MNTVTRNSLSFVILLTVLSSAVQAQERTYIVSPTNSIIETVNADEEFVKYYIYQENKTDSDLVLAWSRVHADIPTGWDYSLCDLGTCYPGIPDGATMAAAPPGEKAFLAMNIYPYGVLGTANIKIAVWDVNNPSIVDTLTWVITIKEKADVDGPSNILPLSIYPNPSSDRMLVTLGNQSGILQIITNHGSEALKVMIHGSSEVSVDVSNLAAGAYTLLFTAQDGAISRAAFIKR